MQRNCEKTIPFCISFGAIFMVLAFVYIFFVNKPSIKTQKLTSKVHFNYTNFRFYSQQKLTFEVNFCVFIDGLLTKKI